MSDDIATIAHGVAVLRIRAEGKETDEQRATWVVRDEIMKRLNRVAARLADTEEAAIGYQRQSADQAAEARKWRKLAEQAERERDEHACYRKVQQTFGEEQHALAQAAEARARELTDALEKVKEQATRHRRATDKHEYLIRDLEFIEDRTRAVLAAHTKEEE